MTSKASHHHVLLLLGYVALVLVIGALLSPVLFFAAQAAIKSSPHGTLASALEGKEFPSYFNRAALLAAIIGLWPLFQSMRMTRLEVLGDEPARKSWRRFLLGFTLAAGLLLVMGGGFFQMGLYKIRPPGNFLAISEPLMSAITVALIEEFLFRGAMLSVLRRSLGNISGAVWLTFIFALVHFLKPPADGALANENVTWMSGFWVVTQLFRGFGEVNQVLAEFCTLLAVGAALAAARIVTGGLWASIGLHAGWVFGLKYFSSLTYPIKAVKREEWLPWIGDNLKVGLVPFVVVLLTGAILVLICRPREKTIATSPK